MLQFGPRLGVRASTRPSIASKDSIESNKPGKHRAGFLTIVVETNPHRTTLNTSTTRP